jgi:hypothetical protein
LDGDPLDKGSRFYRLLLDMGSAPKVHDGRHNTGGSYGFGKAALSSNSGIKTIFAYSRYRDEQGREHTRLFGCGYFRSHRFGSSAYNGQAWFGRERESSAEWQIVDPLEDGDADEIAARLGFRVRDSGDIGTSILIVDTTLEADELRKGVEEWWWPRLIENRLDVEVITPDGSRQIPRPRLRPDLRPFIEAYDIAIGRNQNPTPKREMRKVFNRMGGLELGTCALKVLDMPAEGEDYPVGDDRVDSVALIRVPGMVVSYHRRGRPSTPALVGVFVASDQIDDTLKLSEPPAHDRWDPESTRLRNVDDNHRKAVHAVLTRIYDTVRAFRKDASPSPPPRNRRLYTLERELANFLVGRGPRDPIEHPSAPIHFQYAEDPEPISTNTGQLRARAEFSVRLKDDAEIESTILRLKVKCVVLEDDTEGDRIGYDLRSETELTEEAAHSYLFLVEKDSPVTFTIVTHPYDPLWTVRLAPDVEPVTMGTVQ